MKIEVVDHNYHSDNKVEVIEPEELKNFPISEVSSITIQVDNGRINVFVNNVEAYSNTSLSEGEVRINMEKIKE